MGGEKGEGEVCSFAHPHPDPPPVKGGGDVLGYPRIGSIERAG
jgi:hypothetical protein